MYISYYCKCIPDEHWNHNPNMITNNGCTVAMYLACNNINPPECWVHDPNI